MKNKKICLILLVLCFLFPLFNVFLVIGEEPEDNFYAISKSDNTTQWILQGNETLEEEVFHDDISNGNWDLYGASERYFLKSEEYASNYLLNNYSIGSGYEWMYTDERYYTEVSMQYDVAGHYDQISLCWDGKNWYIANGAGIYKFTENWGWIYHDSFFDIRQHTLTMQPNRDIRTIEWNGSSYFVLFSNDLLWEYKSIFVKYPAPSPAPVNKYYLPFGNIHDIFWDGTYWWILRVYNPTPNTIRLMGVYKFFSNWTYTGMWHNLEEIDEIIGAQQKDVIGYKLEWNGLNWWIGDADYPFSYVYKMYSNFTYTGIRYHRATFDFDLKHSFFWGLENEYVYKYYSEDSIVYNISKNYQGNGYTYVQTDKSEEIGLISSTYSSNTSLKTGDYFEIDFQTSSDSEIKLELINDGLKVKELPLNLGHIFLDEDVEFNQIRFTSFFEDRDYLKIYDIRCYNVTNIEHHTEFYLEPFQSYSIYLTPTTYNLKILEDGEIKRTDEIIISEEPFYYIYYSEPIQCQLFLSSITGSQLDIENIHIKINRSVYGVYDELWLSDTLFYADKGYNITFTIYDQFNSYVSTFETIATEIINLEIEVYSLTIKNMMNGEISILINLTYSYLILPYENIILFLKESDYQINYSTNLGNGGALITLNQDSIYEVNASIIPKSISITYVDSNIGYNDIEWATTGDIEYVLIELYNGSSFVEVISSKTENNGYYSWYISSDHTYDKNYYQIKISDYSNNSIYNFSDYFTIEEPEPEPEPEPDSNNKLIGIDLIPLISIISLATIILLIITKKKETK